jgi:hypothetical protein
MHRTSLLIYADRDSDRTLSGGDGYIIVTVEGAKCGIKNTSLLSKFT